MIDLEYYCCKMPGSQQGNRIAAVVKCYQLFNALDKRLLVYFEQDCKNKPGEYYNAIDWEKTENDQEIIGYSLYEMKSDEEGEEVNEKQDSQQFFMLKEETIDSNRLQENETRELFLANLIRDFNPFKLTLEIKIYRLTVAK